MIGLEEIGILGLKIDPAQQEKMQLPQQRRRKPLKTTVTEIERQDVIAISRTVRPHSGTNESTKARIVARRGQPPETDRGHQRGLNVATVAAVDRVI